jgi:hypothetical protein
VGKETLGFQLTPSVPIQDNPYSKCTLRCWLPTAEYHELVRKDLKFAALIINMHQNSATLLILVSTHGGVTYERLKDGGIRFAWTALKY